MVFRDVTARAVVVVGVAGATWALWLLVCGGVDITLGGLRITSNDPVRPLLLSALAFIAYPALSGAGIHGALRQAAAWIGRTGDSRIALLIAIGTFALGVAYSATAGVAADGYGYVSEVELWLRGDLIVPQPGIGAAPWPKAEWTFAPLGYRPVISNGDWALAPIYSAGLPVLMALAKAAGGQEVMFWVVPACGGLLSWTTFGIGRRLGSARAGLIASWLVATSPAILLMVFQPMSDVPVAAAWALAIFFALGRSSRDVALSGLASALAIVIRPNLSGLAVVLGLWFVLRPPAAGASRGWIARLTQVMLLGACAAPAMLITAALYQHLYGSPFESGYGNISELFSWTHVLPNIRAYWSWFFETHSRLMIAGLVALVLPVRAVWPWVTERSALVMILACMAVVLAQYLSYLVFEGWLFLRFLLLCWPFIMLGVAAVGLLVFQARRPLVSLIAGAAIVLFGFQGLHYARTNHLFELWHGHRRSVDFARTLAREMPARSVFYTLNHSGTLRYYAGLTTVSTLLFDPSWLDRSVAWFKSQGYSVYLVLDDVEVSSFEQRFAGQSLTASIKDRRTLVYAETNSYIVYDLTTESPVKTRFVPIGDLHALRSAPPHPGAFAPQLIPQR